MFESVELEFAVDHACVCGPNVFNGQPDFGKRAYGGVILRLVFGGVHNVIIVDFAWGCRCLAII